MYWLNYETNVLFLLDLQVYIPMNGPDEETTKYTIQAEASSAWELGKVGDGAMLPSQDAYVKVWIEPSHQCPMNFTACIITGFSISMWLSISGNAYSGYLNVWRLVADGFIISAYFSPGDPDGMRVHIYLNNNNGSRLHAWLRNRITLGKWCQIAITWELKGMYCTSISKHVTIKL